MIIMLFLTVSLLFLIGSLILMNKIGIVHPYSKALGLAIALALLAVVSLAQNYTQSLIPEANDGIGISNIFAGWILGEDGLTKEQFRNSYTNYTFLTLLFILAYPFVLLAETRFARKKLEKNNSKAI
jgi:hypothetical protein